MSRSLATSPGTEGCGLGIQVPEALKGADLSKQEKDFSHMEAMICGMTPQERRNPHILNARRRQRGSLPG